MGLFDRFKRRVQEVAEDVDSDELTATEDSEEGQVALQTATEIEEYWDDEPLVEPTETPVEPIESDDEWDDWDDDEDEIELPRQLSKNERKRMEKLEKQRIKELRRRKATDVAKPQGSRVDLSMMRTTTGRQLVDDKAAPRGSTERAAVQAQSATD